MPPDAGHGRSAALAPIQPWSSWQRLTIRSTEGLSHPGFLQRAPLFEGGHSLLFKTSQWLKRFVRPVPCSPWQGGGEDRGHGVPQSKTTISLAPLVPEGANQKIFAANLGRKSILEAETSRVSHMLEDGGGGCGQRKDAWSRGGSGRASPRPFLGPFRRWKTWATWSTAFSSLPL